ncbi:protoporphyrinogen oxidase HemJ [Leptolyngbya sp. FACHB-321]|uniref:protoporphyrinogen oxidase HemJ n=1 Tax=Leptolyngbya sp. FACHB-321 TaxID=2692807 RepID=UPI00168289A4|nr:protoporphyrinogen oxidase HemJ [Leptolyngbya sp. FACHB-321]MBD2038153.1 protoporphyrinogen oxidase HemJ [Leptolyngbya sp. FACHB-321]
MAYYWFKAFHLVGIVCWFAGMFYLPRLFVYHAEANEQPEPARSILKSQYQIMEKRLYSVIMTPAMLLTVAMAIGLVTTEPDVLKQPWMHAKLACVVLLIGYHHYCKRLMKQLAADECKMTGQHFRWFNEFPTVFFIVVVMLAVFKNNLPTDLTVWGIVAMVISFAIAIQLYARKRRLAKERAAVESDGLLGNASS